MKIANNGLEQRLTNGENENFSTLRFSYVSYPLYFLIKF